MICKPIDEMSLRHLFSTNYSNKVLKIEYWGPVVNSIGKIEASPDCYVLDKRNELYKLKKCEFKFIPESINEFRHNGNFDIAILWDLPPKIDKKEFELQLRDRHKCFELIVLSDIKEFRALPEYSIPTDPNRYYLDKMTEFFLTKEAHVIYSAYLIAKAYPNLIDSKKLIDLLVERFREIHEMLPQGRGNAISRFIQTNPPLIIPMYGKYYRWNDSLEPTASLKTMEALFVENFINVEKPDDELVKRIIHSN